MFVKKHIRTKITKCCAAFFLLAVTAFSATNFASILSPIEKPEAAHAELPVATFGHVGATSLGNEWNPQINGIANPSQTYFEYLFSFVETLGSAANSTNKAPAYGDNAYLIKDGVTSSLYSVGAVISYAHGNNYLYVAIPKSALSYDVTMVFNAGLVFENYQLPQMKFRLSPGYETGKYAFLYIPDETTMPRASFTSISSLHNPARETIAGVEVCQYIINANVAKLGSLANNTNSLYGSYNYFLKNNVPLANSASTYFSVENSLYVVSYAHGDNHLYFRIPTSYISDTHPTYLEILQDTPFGNYYLNYTKLRIDPSTKVMTIEESSQRTKYNVRLVLNEFFVAAQVSESFLSTTEECLNLLNSNMLGKSSRQFYTKVTGNRAHYTYIQINPVRDPAKFPDSMSLVATYNATQIIRINESALSADATRSYHVYDNNGAYLKDFSITYKDIDTKYTLQAGYPTTVTAYPDAAGQSSSSKKTFNIVVASISSSLLGKKITGFTVSFPDSDHTYNTHEVVQIDENTFQIQLKYGAFGNFVLTPVFGNVTYSITYNLDGGYLAEANPSTYTMDDTFTLNNPTKTGYAFTGWTLSDESKAPEINYVFKTGNIGDKVFTAHWSANTYNIQYANCTTSNPTSATYDSVVEIIAPTREGHTFDGWVITNQHANARWGTSSSSVETIIPDDGKLFNGASGAIYLKNLRDDTGTATLTACWTVNQYSAKISAGTGISSVKLSLAADASNVDDSPHSYLYGSIVYGFVTLATGYHAQTGWVQCSNYYRVGSQTMGTAGIDFGTISAVANTYTIVYDGNKPSSATSRTVEGLPGSQNCTYDQNVTLGSAPTLSGYTFGGWYKDSACTIKAGDASEELTKPNFVASGTYTLYAKWTPNNYSVTFDLKEGVASYTYKINDGSWTTVTSDTTISIPCDATVYWYVTLVSGYALKGEEFPTQSNPSSFKVDVGGRIIGLEATKIIHITLDTQGAVTSGTTDIYYKYNYYDSKYYYYSDAACTVGITSATITKAIKNSCSFMGYYTLTAGHGVQYVDSNGLIINDLYTIFDSDTTLYACWHLALIINPNGGTQGAGGWYAVMVYNRQFFDIGSTYLPTRNGYTLTGLYTAATGGTKLFNADGTALTGICTYDTNTDIYAQWDANKIIITLSSPDATTLGTDYIYYYFGTNTYYSDLACTSVITSITIPERTYYSFAGYYLGSAQSGTCYISENGTIYNDLYNSVYTDSTLNAEWTHATCHVYAGIGYFVAKTKIVESETRLGTLEDVLALLNDAQPSDEIYANQGSTVFVYFKTRQCVNTDSSLLPDYWHYYGDYDVYSFYVMQLYVEDRTVFDVTPDTASNFKTFAITYAEISGVTYGVNNPTTTLPNQTTSAVAVNPSLSVAHDESYYVLDYWEVTPVGVHYGTAFYVTDGVLYVPATSFGAVLLTPHFKGAEFYFEVSNNTITFSADSQTFYFNAASGGSGSYTYAIKAGETSITVNSSALTYSTVAALAYGVYTPTIVATDTVTEVAVESQFTLTVNKKMISDPLNAPSIYYDAAEHTMNNTIYPATTYYRLSGSKPVIRSYTEAGTYTFYATLMYPDSTYWEHPDSELATHSAFTWTILPYQDGYNSMTVYVNGVRAIDGGGIYTTRNDVIHGYDDDINVVVKIGDNIVNSANYTLSFIHTSFIGQGAQSSVDWNTPGRINVLVRGVAGSSLSNYSTEGTKLWFLSTNFEALTSMFISNAQTLRINTDFSTFNQEEGQCTCVYDETTKTTYYDNFLTAYNVVTSFKNDTTGTLSYAYDILLDTTHYNSTFMIEVRNRYEAWARNQGEDNPYQLSGDALEEYLRLTGHSSSNIDTTDNTALIITIASIGALSMSAISLIYIARRKRLTKVN